MTKAKSYKARVMSLSMKMSSNTKTTMYYSMNIKVQQSLELHLYLLVFLVSLKLSTAVFRHGFVNVSHTLQDTGKVFEYHGNFEVSISDMGNVEI